MSNAKAPKTLTVEQQEDLLESLLCSTSPPKTARKGIRNYLIACLMLDAGLRVGEVVQLRASHLLFNRHPVRSLVVTKDIAKNRRQRSIPVNARLTKAIDDFFSNVICIDDLHTSYQLFTSPKTHKCLTTRQVENIICSAAMKAFGRPVNPHMLRHTFGSDVLRVSDLRVTQELLGHSCVSSTQIYTHPNEEDKQKAIDALHNDVTRSVDDLEELPGLS